MRPFFLSAQTNPVHNHKQRAFDSIEIIGCKNIIIAQNKIDLVSKEDSLKNYQQIKAFVKGTIAENAPIIPISAYDIKRMSIFSFKPLKKMFPRHDEMLQNHH